MSAVPWVAPALGVAVADMTEASILAAELADARRSIQHLEAVLGERDDFIGRLESLTHCPAEVFLANLERARGKYSQPA